MNSVLLEWPYVGIGLAVLLITWIALERRPAGSPPRFRDPASVLPLLWPMYLVHQFEEHGVDVLGRRYAFLAELCGVLGHEDLLTCPVDPEVVFAVNVGGCHIAFILAVALRRTRPLVAACAWGIPIVNAVIHVGSAMFHSAYNPGVVTSLVLFAPLTAWMLRVVVQSGAVERRHVLRIIATGVAMHAVLMGSLLLRERGLVSHGALLSINVANGLLPLVFGLPFTRSFAKERDHAGMSQLT